MSYRDRLITSTEQAQSQLAERLKAVKLPVIYGDGDDLRVPRRLLGPFLKLVEAVRFRTIDSVAPGLLILGKPGVGKTRAIFAMAHLLLKEFWYGEKLFSPSLEPLIVEHVEWVQSVRESVRYGDDNSRSVAKSSVHEIKTWPGFLFIDDIGVAAMPDFVAEQFYILVDYRLKNWMPTVFVSNATSVELGSAFDARILSRLSRWTTTITYE